MIEIKATYHIQVFSGVTHGFSLRGNVKDPIASECILELFYKGQSVNPLL